METERKGKDSHTPRLGKRGCAGLRDLSKNVSIMLFHHKYNGVLLHVLSISPFKWQAAVVIAMGRPSVMKMMSLMKVMDYLPKHH